MSKCRNCVRFVHLNDDGEKTLGHGNWCYYIGDSPDEDLERECCAFRPQTNFDRIRAMTDEELAKFIEQMEVQGYDLHGTFGADYWLDWLRQ